MYRSNLQLLVPQNNSMPFYDTGIRPLDIPWRGLGGVAIIIALTWLFIRGRLRNAEEPAVDYTVPIPEQCQPGWRGEDLNEIQLKVSNLLRYLSSDEIDNETVGSWL